MTASDSTVDASEADRIGRRMRLSRSLTREGYSDVLVLSRDSGREALTASRIEILDYLGEEEPPSVRALARALGRDKGGVSRDLKVLAERDVVSYEDDGRAKAPRLKHETVLVEPLV